MQQLVLAGGVPGLLARVDAQPVGWCALGRRRDFPQYGTSSPESDAWAVPCLYVAPRGRGLGVSRRLVGRAVEVAASAGASVIHGPPPWWEAGSATAISSTTAAFLANGFVVTAPGARMPLLELRL